MDLGVECEDASSECDQIFMMLSSRIDKVGPSLKRPLGIGSALWTVTNNGKEISKWSKSFCYHFFISNRLA